MTARIRFQHPHKKRWLLPTPVAPVLREVKKNGYGLLVARQPSSRFSLESVSKEQYRVAEEDIWHFPLVSGKHVHKHTDTHTPHIHHIHVYLPKRLFSKEHRGICFSGMLYTRYIFRGFNFQSVKSYHFNTLWNWMRHRGQSAFSQLSIISMNEIWRSIDTSWQKYDHLRRYKIYFKSWPATIKAMEKWNYKILK